MPVHLWDKKLTYLPVPKVACTSLKKYFFRVENGFDYRGYKKNGRRSPIHHVYPSAAFSELPVERVRDHHRVAVVRDPVSRIVSCYENKVMSEKALENRPVAQRLKRADLPSRPDLGTFIERLPEYRREVEVIRAHSEPLRHHLGEDPAYFGRIYRLTELDEFEQDMKKRLGTNVCIVHSNRSRVKVGALEVTSRVRARIEQLFADDFALFGNWFASA